MDLAKLKKLILNSNSWKESEEIVFGWSGERKFKIVDENNKEYLLRLLTPNQYEDQKDGIEYLIKSSEVCEYVPKIAGQGETADKEYFYLLLEYIPGENGMTLIKNYTKKQQYELGYKMGRVIKKLHKLSIPTLKPTEIVKYEQKVKKFYDYFVENRAKYPFLKNTENIIKEFESYIQKRPMVMLHNDFHLGNMIINDKEIYLIDFNRASWGDNIKEFDCLAWTVKYSKQFAIGLLDAYLKNIEYKDEFFKILRGYIAIWQIQMLYFIHDQDEEEQQTVINLVKETETWFKKDEVVPKWYLKKEDK